MDSDSAIELQRLLGPGSLTIHELGLQGSDEGAKHQGRCSLLVSTPRGQRVRLDFLEVRNLEFRTGPYTPIRVAGLDIDELTRDQWPGVRFRVHSEDEQEIFSILCADIEYSLEDR
ncbi:MAG: hypothetical protein AAF726_16285 [Planctomycetota bacterium]